jgi:hypothetical protein
VQNSKGRHYKFNKENMTNYYYDEEEQKLLAIDTETHDVRVLEPIDFDDAEDEPAPKHGPAVKVSKQPKSGAGCPECGSKSRHRKECSKAAGGKAASAAKSSKLSEGDFDVCKEQQADEATGAQVAKRFDYPIEEVNDAFASDSYRTYKVL